jgi:hypothetical protein
VLQKAGEHAGGAANGQAAESQAGKGFAGGRVVTGFVMSQLPEGKLLSRGEVIEESAAGFGDGGVGLKGTLEVGEREVTAGLKVNKGGDQQAGMAAREAVEDLGFVGGERRLPSERFSLEGEPGVGRSVGTNGEGVMFQELKELGGAEVGRRA